MRKGVLVLLAAVFLAAPASAAFGNGSPVFEAFLVSGEPRGQAAEPTIGIPWNTDNVFFRFNIETWRGSFNDAGVPTWTEVTPESEALTNLDPMLHADPDTGRIWTGGLATSCSIMAYSDNDGETWSMTGNMCSGPYLDHQSIGSGPFSTNGPQGDAALYDHATYYCAQDGSGTGCITSLDGGVTWGQPVRVTGGCGGPHGHIRVSPVTGTAIVPHSGCDDFSTTGLFVGNHQGFAITTDNGLTWDSQFTPAPYATRGFDPSAQFTRESGWLYFANANEAGAAIALSKNEGQAWEALGEGMDVDAAKWLDVGQFHDPPILAAMFADVQAGDDDRVAFSFLGIEATGDDAVDAALQTSAVYQCAEGDLAQEDMVWHYYVAMSHDAGDTWTVTRATEDPVQVGGIYDGGFGTGDDSCRNLLDFNDLDIDSTGRLYVAFADGCVGECAAVKEPDTEGYRTAIGTILRQTDGRGLFAEYDVEQPSPNDDDIDSDGIPDHRDDDIDGDGIPNQDDSDPTTAKKALSSGTLALLAILWGAMVLRRRP